MLVSRRYETRLADRHLNKPFSGSGEIFGDEVTAAAMIDRLVHRAEFRSLKGDSYGLEDRDLAVHRTPSPRNRLTDHPRRSVRGPQTAITRPDPSANRANEPASTAPLAHAEPVILNS